MLSSGEIKLSSVLRELRVQMSSEKLCDEPAGVSWSPAQSRKELRDLSESKKCEAPLPSNNSERDLFVADVSGQSFQVAAIT